MRSLTPLLDVRRNHVSQSYLHHTGRIAQVAAIVPDARRRAASELTALAPDVIFANGSSGAEAMLQATRTIPIVFVLVPDLVAAGLVDSLARPGGNAIGFMTFEYSMGGKWLELLKQIAPRVTRVGVLREATQVGGVGQFSAIHSVAPSLGIEAVPINVRRDAEGIEQALTDFARSANGGLIVTGSGLAVVHRHLIVTLAAGNRLPAVYWAKEPVVGGGLISYGVDLRDQFRRAAIYIDRILRGEKPTDLPVQAPTKYEFVINLKTDQGARLRNPAAPNRARRRGDRIKITAFARSMRPQMALGVGSLRCSDTAAIGG
jgi:putative tryptophan/tyrosine transport system substrate-binding protein